MLLNHVVNEYHNQHRESTLQEVLVCVSELLDDLFTFDHLVYNWEKDWKKSTKKKSVHSLKKEVELLALKIY
jgi:hypothetical protein